MSSFTYDGESLLAEQSELLSSSTPFDINYVAFLRTKLSAQQRLTMQRNQEDRRACSGSRSRGDTSFQNTSLVRSNLQLQSPEPRAQPPRASVSSDRLSDSPGSGSGGRGYRPFGGGLEAFSEYPSHLSAARRGSAAVPGPRRNTDLDGSDGTGGYQPDPTPKSYDDVPASASARQELASVTNMGDSLTTPESYVRESRARSFASAAATDPVRSSAIGGAGGDGGAYSSSFDDRVAVAKGRPEIPEDAVPFASGDADGTDDSDLVPCPHCGRTFASDRVERHAALCAKQKARDAKKPKGDAIKAKRMTQLYEGESVAPPAQSHTPTKDPESLNATWRRQSAQLRTALSGGPNGGAGMYPVEDDRVQCPGCGRRFAKDVADRHTPLCLAKANRGSK